MVIPVATGIPNMRTRQTMTVSLPPEMIADVERVRKREHRTRSELVREALRAYFVARRTLPTYTPTAAELRAIRAGRAAIRRGEYYTLDEFNTWLLGGAGKKAGAKKRPARASA